MEIASYLVFYQCFAYAVIFRPNAAWFYSKIIFFLSLIRYNQSVASERWIWFSMNHITDYKIYNKTFQIEHKLVLIKFKTSNLIPMDHPKLIMKILNVWLIRLCEISFPSCWELTVLALVVHPKWVQLPLPLVLKNCPNLTIT